MNHLPHELRVIAEKSELDTRIFALGQFFGNALFQQLDFAEQALLEEQFGHMSAYTAVLKARIAAFPPIVGVINGDNPGPRGLEAVSPATSVRTDELPYDFEDFGMDANQLLEKYDGNEGHPEYTIDKWRAGPCMTSDTNGYWDWVIAMIAQDDISIPSNVTELNPDLAGQAVFKEAVPVGAKPIEDVNTFAMMVDHWHAQCMERGNRVLQIPEGTIIEVADESTPGQTIEMDLNGPYLQVFRVGVMTVLHLFKDLPFGASIEESANDPAAS